MTVAAAAFALGVAPTSARALQSADEPLPAAGVTGPSGPSGSQGILPAQPEIRLTRGQTKHLQRRLRVHVDGRLGRRTRTALARWERRAGLPVDGRPDTVVLRRMRIRLTSAQATAAVSRPATTERTAAKPEACEAVGPGDSRAGVPVPVDAACPGAGDRASESEAPQPGR